MMERWIQMHYQIKSRERALEISKNRELFYWVSSFYMVSFVGSLLRYQRLKQTNIFTPMIPLTFVTAYFADLAYGSKLHRIKAEADMIMQHEDELLDWPGGLPTVASIDEARTEAEMEKKMHPHAS
uniref:Plasminogen receptor (KT) n=1 Tax=Megaselia scalaris TaxID=36166 RepID=T1GWL2_MEGSC